MPLGSYDFKGQMSGRLKFNRNAHATAPTCTVPAGKVWNVKAVSMTTTANAACNIFAGSGVGGTGFVLALSHLTLAERTLETVFSEPNLDLWLEEGDTVYGASNTAGVLTVHYVEYDKD